MDESRAESTEGSKVESIDRVDRQLPWIDRLARLDQFWGVNPNPNPNPKSNNNVCSTKRHGNKVQHSTLTPFIIFAVFDVSFRRYKL